MLSIPNVSPFPASMNSAIKQAHNSKCMKLRPHFRDKFRKRKFTAYFGVEIRQLFNRSRTAVKQPHNHNMWQQKADMMLHGHKNNYVQMVRTV